MPAPAPAALTRLIVLPFRLLRPDADTDFLAFSLPDAVSAALSSLESVIVRSSLSAGPPTPQRAGPAGVGRARCRSMRWSPAR